MLLLALVFTRSTTSSTMTVTTVLFDNMRSNSHSRHQVEHSGSRNDFVIAVISELDSRSPKITNIQFLNEGNWITQSEFILVETSLPRFVRCLVEDAVLDDNAVVGMLPWRRFGSVTFATGDDSKDLTIAKHKVRLGERSVGIEGPHGATGLTLWDGSLYLASFLNQHPELLNGKRVLELGAGQVISHLFPFLKCSPSTNNI